jgi:hypothetical protein
VPDGKSTIQKGDIKEAKGGLMLQEENNRTEINSSRWYSGVLNERVA